MYIKEDLLSFNKYSRPGRALKAVLGIVNHWYANPGTTAEQTKRFFENRRFGKSGFGSAQYLIGLEGEIIRDIPDLEMAYHVGSQVYTKRALNLLGSYPNNCTIGIEWAHLDWDGTPTKETWNAAVRLNAKLLKEHCLDVNDLWLHYDVVGWKDCHRHFVRHNAKWIQFKSEVAKAMKSDVVIMEPTPEESKTKYVEMYGLGDKGEKVKEVQGKLLKAGMKLPKFGADGDFGEETENAVMAFQAKYKLAIDGIVGPKTMAKLNEVIAPKAPSKESEKKQKSNLIKEGDKGSKVVEVQKKLIAHGENLNPYGADGDFGPKTEKAVKSFQSKKGLSVDGVVGPKTMAELNKSPKKVVKDDGKAIVAYPGLIKKGSRGKNVKRIQRAVGVNLVDGIFGSDTEKAVKVYQKRHGLQVDGLVGRVTWNEMF